MSNLRNVANLNFQNIAFEDFEKSVKAVATVPQLRSLYINLESEDQVDMIMRHLPNLEYLNGLPVERDALDESLQESQSDIRNAVMAEAEANGTAQINEEVAEAEDESIIDNGNAQNEVGNTSLLSA